MTNSNSFIHTQIFDDEKENFSYFVCFAQAHVQAYRALEFALYVGRFSNTDAIGRNTMYSDITSRPIHRSPSSSST